LELNGPTLFFIQQYTLDINDFQYENKFCGFSFKRGIHLTQATTTCSVLRYKELEVSSGRKRLPPRVSGIPQMVSNESACRRYLAHCRWPTGFECPRCGTGDAPWTTARGYLHCKSSGSKVSVTAGTIFERTRMSLQSWFAAMWFPARRMARVPWACSVFSD
jgi:hypothetical protein